MNANSTNLEPIKCDQIQGVRRQKYSEGATFSNDDITMM